MDTTDDPTGALAEARAAHRARDWPTALELFRRVGDRGSMDARDLEARDLEAWADCAWWLGLVDECIAVSERAYRANMDQHRPAAAAMVAVGIAYSSFLRGEAAAGSGWLSRAQRLLADIPECVEHGYLMYIDVEGALAAGDADETIAAARRVRDFGSRFGDATLVALGTLGEGRALLRQGRVADGFALLDEAMLAVAADDVAPEFAGNLYCHLIAACYELADLRRAAEWTSATERWLAQLPEAVVFSGICRVHRAQLLQASGEWERAAEVAERVCVDVAEVHLTTAAEAHYAIGEIRRLQGDLAGAQHAFAQAQLLGRDPQPGMALLRLAQGKVESSGAALRAALAAESRGVLARVPLLAAQAEVAVEAGDLDTAAAACRQLDEAATTYATAGLAALARQARGALALARGEMTEALPVLRAACGLWQELLVPYAVARVRVLLARAYEALGDAEAAATELDAAYDVFTRLAAAPDLAIVARLRRRRVLPDGLTAREAEVLALVATGQTNREVAASLVLSEKTVARHLSNIFAKLGLTSRTAATAYAFEHGLVDRPRG